jgi:hypothetical protein
VGKRDSESEALRLAHGLPDPRGVGFSGGFGAV